MKKRRGNYENSKVNSLKKSLGQNFLRDDSVIDEIVAVADVQGDDVVIEVGPGDGALTAALARSGVRVIAIETDADLIPALEERFSGAKNVTVIHADIRTFNLPAFIAEEGITSYKVVANLPYYITSMIIRLFLESQTPPSDMTIMVQKEVAQRIIADAGNHSVLSLSVQYFGSPSLEIIVPATAFEPVPQVDSAVLHIANITQGDAITTKQFFRVVRAGFSAKRKKLIGNVANALDIEKEMLKKHLEECGVSENARAQELTLEQWKKLAQILGQALKE